MTGHKAATKRASRSPYIKRLAATVVGPLAQRALETGGALPLQQRDEGCTIATAQRVALCIKRRAIGRGGGGGDRERKGEATCTTCVVGW